MRGTANDPNAVLRHENVRDSADNHIPVHDRDDHEKLEMIQEPELQQRVLQSKLSCY